MKKGIQCQLSFEQKLQQFELIIIVIELETEDVTLEIFLRKYQERKVLFVACQEELGRAEMVIRTFQEASISTDDKESAGDKEMTPEVAECS
jgi:exonuclease VII small subunit